MTFEPQPPESQSRALKMRIAPSF